MPTIRRICAIAFLTVALSTFASGEEGWISTGHKPPQPTSTAPTASFETSELINAETGEESSYFDEFYEATLIFLQLNLL